MSIFTFFVVMSTNSLCPYIDFLCWLANNANHNTKTMKKQKFLKPVNRATAYKDGWCHFGTVKETIQGVINKHFLVMQVSIWLVTIPPSGWLPGH